MEIAGQMTMFEMTALRTCDKCKDGYIGQFDQMHYCKPDHDCCVEWWARREQKWPGCPLDRRKRR